MPPPLPRLRAGRQQSSSPHKTARSTASLPRQSWHTFRVPSSSVALCSVREKQWEDGPTEIGEPPSRTLQISLPNSEPTMTAGILGEDPPSASDSVGVNFRKPFLGALGSTKIAACAFACCARLTASSTWPSKSTASLAEALSPSSSSASPSPSSPASVDSSFSFLSLSITSSRSPFVPVSPTPVPASITMIRPATSAGSKGSIPLALLGMCTSAPSKHENALGVFQGASRAPNSTSRSHNFTREIPERTVNSQPSSVVSASVLQIKVIVFSSGT
mmetsp:Transcript_16037/g.55762  ORF Transcript_16037/g.55762 Transcript_16037/m.55762 type:complete len:275 (-) Transcript_16037:1678-2502(-)